MNTLHPTETLTLDNLNINWELINLSPEKIELLNKLEKNSHESKETFLKELINEETTWKDLDDYNYVLERKRDPNLKFLDKEEASEYLNQLFLNKQPHDLRT